ncbi:MAG: hypothetical protein ABI837_21125 [Acidobacteriota bacterium]
MAKEKKSGGTGSFSSAEAKFILESLVRDKRVGAEMLQEYRSKHQDTITGYLERLRELGVEVAHAAAHAGAEAVSKGAASVKSTAVAAIESVSNAAKKAKRKVKANISPDRELTQRLQGQFLGLSRAIENPKVKADFSQQYKSVQGAAKQPVIDAMRRYVDGAKVATQAKGKRKPLTPKKARR